MAKIIIDGRGGGKDSKDPKPPVGYNLDTHTDRTVAQSPLITLQAAPALLLQAADTQKQ